MRPQAARRKQSGLLWLTEALVAMIIISVVLVPALRLIPDLGVLQSHVSEDAALSTLASSAGEALRLTGEFPPCGATVDTTGTCVVPDGVISTDYARRGFTVSATAAAVAFDPSSISGSTAAGDFFRITGVATSPTGRTQAFETVVAKP